MRFHLLLVAMLLVAGVAPATATADTSCSFPVTETDVTGTDVTVDEPPERVVTLNPSAAQTMWEIDAKDKVVGVTKHASNLDGADEKTNISGDSKTINVEEVVDLEPDLVLAPNVVDTETVDKLRETGLTVYHFPSEESLDDVYEKTELTGALTGECNGADETVSWMQNEISTTEETIENETRPDVLYVFFGYTAGSNTFIHEIIETAGGTNVAAEVGIDGYAEISEETVVDQDPDWIILNTNSPELPDSAAYEQSTAVQQDQVVTVNVNYLNRPAPRVVHAITTLSETFYPDVYESDMNNESTPANQTESSDDTEPAEQPGFSAVAAIIALLVAVGMRG